MFRTLSQTKFWLLILIIGLFAFESTEATIKKKRSSYVGNPWSFQFAIDGRADVPGEDEFSGIRLSLTRNLDKYTSVRVSLGGFEKRNGFDNNEWIDTDRFLFTPFNSRRFNVEGGYISAQYLVHPSRNRRLDFYFGAGPRLSVEEGDGGTLAIRNISRSNLTVDLFDTDRAHLLGAGVETTAGLEWFIGRKFSLIGEYGFVVQHQWYLIDVDYIDNFGHTWTDTESFSDGLHFNGGHVKLGFAVHF